MSLQALIHLGSSSVSGGLLDGKKLIFATTQPCRFQEKLDQKAFTVAVQDALKQVLKDLIGAKLGAPEQVTIFLASPFVAGQLNFLKRESDKTFKVTEKLVQELTQADLTKLSADKQHLIIDSRIMRLVINGYGVVAPMGQNANTLEVAHYVSIGDRALLEQCRQIVRGAWHQDKVCFRSGALAAFVVVGALRPGATSFVLVEVGGEVTELSFVGERVLQETFSFPLGSHALVRDNTREGLTPAVAHSHLHLGLKPAARASKEWREALTSGLRQVLKHGFWSGELVLIPEDAALANHFVNLLADADVARITFSAKPVETSILEPGMLAPMVETTLATPTLSLPLLVDAAFMLI